MYLGYRGGEAVVVREFHPVDSSELGEPEIERMKKVRPSHFTRFDFLGDKD